MLHVKKLVKWGIAMVTRENTKPVSCGENMLIWDMTIEDEHNHKQWR